MKELSRGTSDNTHNTIYPYPSSMYQTSSRHTHAHGGKKHVGHLIVLWSLNGCRSCRHVLLFFTDCLFCREISQKIAAE